MSFKSSETTLGSEVATSGTFTLSYPANTSAGTFAAHGHTLWLDKLQYLASSPTDFTVSFGASNITVTWLGSTTLPVGCRANAQLNIEGADDGQLVTDVDESELKRSILTNLVEVNLGSPDTADPDGILNDASATDSAQSYDSSDWESTFGGTLDVPRNLTATGTAGSDHVITVTGKDEYGVTMTEDLTLSGTNVISGAKAFSQVTGVAVAAGAAGDTFDLGWGDVLGLPFYLEDAGQIIQEFEDGAMLVRNNGKVFIQDHMLEAAVDAGTSLELVSPVAGNITKLTTVARGTITTGGAITVEVNTTAVDGLSVTVADASSAGDVDSDTPTAGHATTAVAVGDRIEIIPEAAFNASADIFVILEIDLDAGEQLLGDAVVGASAAATATTGDVRGTYDPATACDGSKSFDLLVLSPDPKYLGVTQA